MVSKPEPIFKTKTRPVCPVCGKTSYSKDGIHPQCALVKAEEPRMKKIKAKQKAEREKKRAQSQ